MYEVQRVIKMLILYTFSLAALVLRNYIFIQKVGLNQYALMHCYTINHNCMMWSIPFSGSMAWNSTSSFGKVVRLSWHG